MSEMVERVGKVIWDAHHAWLARSDPAERLSDACGRAAIAAMMEPTEAMTDAADRVHVLGADLHDFVAYGCAGPVWWAMIAEALK
jgi:hypothetical protein